MAWKVTVGLASRWPCVTDARCLSTHRLSGLVREMSTSPVLHKELSVGFTLPFGRIYLFVSFLSCIKFCVCDVNVNKMMLI